MFACMRCSYAASDLAGTLKLQYNPIVRVIRVPCTGRVDIIHILRGIVNGADAVIVVGCHKGDCGYISGNLAAERRVKFVSELLKQMNVNPDRVQMHFVSAAEANEVVQIVEKVAKQVDEMGPSPFRNK
ncbi:MAG: hydrogenase iron-sulfur subunit [Candidatus Helarchaeota archaeon]